MATAQSTAVRPPKKFQTFPRTPEDSPAIDVQSLLSALPQERLLEVIAVEQYDWPSSLCRKVMRQLEKPQRAFLDFICQSNCESTKEVQERFKLDSPEEVEQLVTDLRAQLEAMKIPANEVYYTELYVDPAHGDPGRVMARYSPTMTFEKAWYEVRYPKQAKKREQRRQFATKASEERQQKEAAGGAA